MNARSKNLLDGHEAAKKRMAESALRVERIRETGGERLALATIQVGHAKDTELYAASIGKLLAKAGIDHVPSVSPEKISQEELVAKIQAFNDDPLVTGILVFAPLPAHLHAASVLNAVDLLKDVEGRRVLNGNGRRVLSPTAEAVMALLEETGEDLTGKEAVVVGHSDIVGKPVAILLLDRYATVTVCHVKTRDLRAHVERADIVVAAAGKPNLIKGAWVKPGATVIDVGENWVAGKLCGDVEFEAARERAAFISPVPGGVGPVTNAMLVRNLLKLYDLRKEADGNL